MEAGKLIKADFTKNTSRAQRVGHAARSAITFSQELLKKSGSKSYNAQRAVKNIAEAELTPEELIEAEHLAIELSNRTEVGVLQFPLRQTPSQYEEEQK